MARRNIFHPRKANGSTIINYNYRERLLAISVYCSGSTAQVISGDPEFFSCVKLRNYSDLKALICLSNHF